MSNLDITTLKEKLKNIPTPRPRTIEWCDKYPISYEDATMRYSAPAEKQSNKASNSYHNSYHKQEIKTCNKDYMCDEQSFILLHLQTTTKQLFTGVNMVGIPAPGTKSNDQTPLSPIATRDLSIQTVITTVITIDSRGVQ
jgi:hypothetical protein